MFNKVKPISIIMYNNLDLFLNQDYVEALSIQKVNGDNFSEFLKHRKIIML